MRGTHSMRTAETRSHTTIFTGKKYKNKPAYNHGLSPACHEALCSLYYPFCGKTSETITEKNSEVRIPGQRMQDRFGTGKQRCCR